MPVGQGVQSFVDEEAAGKATAMNNQLRHGFLLSLKSKAGSSHARHEKVCEVIGGVIVRAKERFDLFGDGLPREIMFMRRTFKRVHRAVVVAGVLFAIPLITEAESPRTYPQ